MALSEALITQSFLQGIHGVVEAHVWKKGDSLLCRVVVLSDANLTGADLQSACLAHLGAESTPTLFLVSQAERESSVA